MTRPLVIAHRGASAYEVENSIAAFTAAKARGADAVELDVHVTADGALVVHHDDALPDGRALAELTLHQLDAVKLPNGEPLPTLEDALTTCDPLGVYVEVKALPQQSDGALYAALEHGPTPSKYAVHSFDHRIISRIGLARPKLPRGVLEVAYPIRPLAAILDTGARVLWQERSLVDRALVDVMHDEGIQLFVWTVDDADEMRRCIDIGVDGLCTNKPDVARRIVGGVTK